VRRCRSCGEQLTSDRFPSHTAAACWDCRARSFPERTRDVPLSPGHVLRVAVRRDGATGRLVLSVARLEARGGHVAVGGTVVLRLAALPELIEALEELAE
jgi:hypothetical protein